MFSRPNPDGHRPPRTHPPNHLRPIPAPNATSQLRPCRGRRRAQEAAASANHRGSSVHPTARPVSPHRNFPCHAVIVLGSSGVVSLHAYSCYWYCQCTLATWQPETNVVLLDVAHHTVLSPISFRGDSGDIPGPSALGIHVRSHWQPEY